MTTIKEKLTTAYKILAYLKMDDHTYTHLSARNHNSFFIYPFGLRFEEVKSETLMEISLNGNVFNGSEFQCNKTGHIMHSAIYNARSDIQAIFHIHTPHITAVSACEEGLLPISQWALHFFSRLSYHNYNSLLLDFNITNELILDLKQNYVMFLRNHGAIICGKTIEEAMFFSYHLEQACKTQYIALAMNKELVIPSKEICEKAVNDLLTFESNLGERDWKAWERLINRGFCDLSST